MKKFDKSKTYNVRYKDNDARKAAWIHLHCLVNHPGALETRGLDDKDLIKYLKRRAGIAYQVMTLYMECELVFNDFGQAGYAYGGFLNYIAELNKESLKYLKITEKKG